MLITQTWTLNTYPSREEVYDRARRFKEHCKKLGIPNPYSISEIYSADERWKKLQRNAEPSLMDLNKGEVKPDESKKVVEVLTAFSVPEEDADFNF
jgi:branched-subunit amino acid aminotransferase/4-amino-4-deoxychorismate lyase